MSRDRKKNSEPVPPGDKSREKIPAGENERGQKRISWSFVLLVLVLLAPFASILIAPDGRVLGDSKCDGPKAYYHYGYFLGQCWRDGMIPLWNPHIMLGIPFLGEGQASIFHPLSFLYVFLKPSIAMNWLNIVSFALSGAFFYGYLRALNLGRPASWCGAVTWSFSTAMISRIFAGHLNIMLVFISIPMVLMFWEHYRTSSHLRHLAGLAAGYGLMILAFYPQMLYIFSLFFLGYVLIQSVTSILDHTSTIQREGKSIVMLGAFTLLGIGIGAIQLLPSLDFVSQSFRRESSLEFSGTFSFAPENLLTLIAPRFFGIDLGATPTRYWGRNLFWEMSIYIGVLPLLLSVAGAWAAPRRQRWTLLVCAAVFLIFGFGKHTFLFSIFYEHLPLFDIFRGASKYTLITLFCLVTLSAYGFEALFGASSELKQKQLRRITAIAGLSLLVVCGVVAMSLLRQPEAVGSDWERFVKWVWATGERHVAPVTENMQEIVQATARSASSALTRSAVLIVISLALVFLKLPERGRKFTFTLPIILILIDLLGVFAPLMATFDKTISQAPLVLDESLKTPYPPRILVPFNPMPNLAMRSGYSSVFGYTGNTLKRYNDFINHLQNLDPQESRAESRFVRFTPQFSALGFDAVAFHQNELPPRARPIGRLGDRVLTPFYETNNEQRRRAFLAAAPKYFSRKEDALPYVLSPKSDVFVRPSIERNGDHLDAHPLEEEESVRFVSFKPNRVELEVTAKYPRELILCSMFEKNWKAKVNGAPAKIEPANYVFRAVQVPQGTSRVIFDYSPMTFYIGAIITGFSLVVVLVLFVKPAIKSNSNQAPVQLRSKAVPA